MKAQRCRKSGRQRPKEKEKVYVNERKEEMVEGGRLGVFMSVRVVV